MKIKYFKLVQNSRPYANNITCIYARTYFLSASCVSEFPLAISYDSELHINPASRRNLDTKTLFLPILSVVLWISFY